MWKPHQRRKDDRVPGEAPSEDAAPKKPGRKKLLLGGIVVLVLGTAGVAYATGILSKLTGGAAEHEAAAIVAGSIDLPEIVANLNAGSRRTSFIRLKARLELTNKMDEAAVTAGQPRLLDMFLTYLRDMRPDELHGSASTYRLREELLARANIALAPAHVTDILFIELLIQ